MEESSLPKKPLKQKQGSTKIDPSFKSKRYRDKLRTEVKALEGLIPIDRPTLHRKLDSQTVYRLVIAFLRIKNYFKAVHLQDTSSVSLNPDQQARSVDQTAATHCTKMESKMWKEINVNELIEGFILMLSVDGTIMYVSENVLHFNGFNQVDLIHRCIYGIIHPEDQYEVRSILEENGVYSFNHQMELSSIRKKTHLGLQDDGGCNAVSFFCRMKCFVGNTAGYMKLHCSGKLQSMPGIPKSNKTSDRIVTLFCQPFIYNGNDVMNDSKDNLFWSKHDLALTFKETENKITDILGYEGEELNDVSMYQLVHVEDLHTLVMAHNAITEVTEVQSFFMRLKHKDNSWRWLHSKGKVISKNSKKFSVVFTHCPIRDDNSAFLQQEMLLRQKHSLVDLIQLSTFRNCTNDPVSDNVCNPARNGMAPCSYSEMYPNYSSTKPHAVHVKRHKNERSEYLREFCESPNEEVSVILNPVTFVPVPCPSTWHSTADRHSPVVPSSHVAHKLCLKEKQLQYAQLKRTQQSGQRVQKFESCFGLSGHCEPQQMYYKSNINTTQHAFQPMGQKQQSRDINSDLYHQSLYLYNVDPLVHPQGHPQGHQQEQRSDTQHVYYTKCRPTEFFNYPPSPPPSPMRCTGDAVPFIDNSQFGICQQNIAFHELGSHVVKHIPPKHSRLTLENKYCSTCDGLSVNDQTSINSNNPCNCNTEANHYRSHANIKFSMIVNPSRSNIDQINRMAPLKPHGNLIRERTNNSATIISPDDHVTTYPANQMKYEAENNQSCSLESDQALLNSSPDCVHYDVEASIHMKIVETDIRTGQSCPDVQIPAFDSFMDFLTDEKIY